jgi:hypothetical protein
VSDEPAPGAEAATEEQPPFDDLAPLYRSALLLDAQGVEHPEMASTLGVPVESVPALLRLAHEKSRHAAPDRRPPGR